MEAPSPTAPSLARPGRAVDPVFAAGAIHLDSEKCYSKAFGMNHQLQTELLEMQRADLALRQRLANQGTLFGEYNEQMAMLHRCHNERFADILTEHGWPHRHLVGDEGTAAAWLVLQHAVLAPPLMRSSILLIERAVNEGSTDPRHLALLVDRVRTLDGQNQVYGTQHDWDDYGLLSPLPIEDPGNVDARRAAVGMEPLTEHTKRLRARAQEEGEFPPADLEAHRREARKWARSVGWRQ